jgi:hypothetical protein
VKAAFRCHGANLALCLTHSLNERSYGLRRLLVSQDCLMLRRRFRLSGMRDRGTKWTGRAFFDTSQSAAKA